MKICEELRQAVLQAAIQGKLTRQRKEDGDARDLLKQIAEEKAQLIKDKKIKKEKPLPEITVDEIPFDIPENWCWVRLSDVADVRDGTHDTPSYVLNGYPLITGKDFFTGKFDLSKTQYISQEDYIGISKRSKVDVGDILFSMIGGNIGSMIYVDKNNYFEMAIKNVALFKEYNYSIDISRFLYVFLQSSVNLFKNIASGGAQSFVSLKMLRNFLFPLPPLAEQQRIVAKVDKLMAEIDELEKVEKELAALKESFPGDMKAALLQAAMQGKLTTQRKEDGDARKLLKQIAEEKAQLIKEGKLKKEKPLAEITEDEIPFDIPENWEWVRIQDVCYLSSGNVYNLTERGYLYIKVADMNLKENLVEIQTSNNRATGKEEDLIPRYSIIFPKRGGAILTNKKRIVLKEAILVDSNTMAITPINRMTLKYLYMWFKSINLGSFCTGSAVPQINNKDIYPLLFPLPPLAEQERIVAKLDKLLPLVDGLREE